MNKIVRDLKLIVNRINNKITYKDNGYFVFGEWMGKRADDNCLYLANYIYAHYPEIPIAWVSSKTADLSLLDEHIERYDFSSNEGKLLVRNARVLIMNQGLVDFSESESFNVSMPLKINLWHGVAWKKIGYNGIPYSRGFRDVEHRFQICIRNADIFLAPSISYQVNFSKAFFIKESNFIKAGFPRNCMFYDKEHITKCKKKILELLNDDAKIIVYLPTFRDSHTKPFSFMDIKDKLFFTWLEENNIYIIQKAHAAESTSFSSSNSHIINMLNISAQELMAASDMLITDYSSCFFDYLLLDRPIIHYLYDYDYYKNKDRGLYYEKEDVICGSAPETEEELIREIKENLEDPHRYHTLRMKRKEKFLTYESSNSCEIITQRIFRELREKGVSI